MSKFTNLSGQLATISRLRAFRACARYHHLSYNERWESTGDDAETMAYGTCGHRVLEVWWGMLGAGATADDTIAACLALIDSDREIRAALNPYQRASLTAVITGYHLRWWEPSQTYEVLHVEAEFRAPLRNPMTGRPMRGWNEGGKIDVIVRDRADGRVYIIEHKFSGEDVSPGSSYWRRLRVDGQVSIYLDGARALGYEAAGAIYDVISRPGQKPCKATPPELREYTQGKGCKLCGGKVGVRGHGHRVLGGVETADPCPGCDDGWVEPPRLYAKQRATDESPEEYRDRIAAAIAADPRGYYGRGDVVRFEDEAEDARIDVYETTLAIRAALKTGRHPRNTDACTRLYGRTCPFLPVCSREATLDDSTLYRRRSSAHPELATESPKEPGQGV